ncbi:hypothetical protein EVAR_15982_1 [Eumeta japonica]|uniref:Uncharacterized protein n=1 Tax=Eumeta variegata TaxID=151549 RepID=A0A4C1ULK7_EUMVA|nr:hypothetical protein EVAR_15982_1 [Eumeta japonica]
MPNIITFSLLAALPRASCVADGIGYAFGSPAFDSRVPRDADLDVRPRSVPGGRRSLETGASSARPHNARRYLGGLRDFVPTAHDNFHDKANILVHEYVFQFNS